MFIYLIGSMIAHAKIGTDSMKRLFTHRSSFQLAITAHPHSVTCNRIAPDDKDNIILKKFLIYYKIKFFYGLIKIIKINSIFIFIFKCLYII